VSSSKNLTQVIILSDPGRVPDTPASFRSYSREMSEKKLRMKIRLTSRSHIATRREEPKATREEEGEASAAWLKRLQAAATYERLIAMVVCV